MIFLSDEQLEHLRECASDPRCKISLHGMSEVITSVVNELTELRRKSTYKLFRGRQLMLTEAIDMILELERVLEWHPVTNGSEPNGFVLVRSGSSVALAMWDPTARGWFEVNGLPLEWEPSHWREDTGDLKAETRPRAARPSPTREEGT